MIRLIDWCIADTLEDRGEAEKIASYNYLTMALGEGVLANISALKLKQNDKEHALSSHSELFLPRQIKSNQNLRNQNRSATILEPLTGYATTTDPLIAMQRSATTWALHCGEAAEQSIP